MNQTILSLKELQKMAVEVRKKILFTAHYHKQGHVGGSLSCADILTTLFFTQLAIDPDNPDWEDRDRFVLSKGHTALGLYVVYALRGYFPEEELKTFDQYNSRLQAHPDMTRLDALDMSTGSLGQGISAAVGMAIGAKWLERNFHVYTLIGDGESQEGQVWEALNTASKYDLDNLIVTLDNNGLQQFGWKHGASRGVPETEAGAKFKSFGFDVFEVDGHDLTSLVDVYEEARLMKNNRPKAIVANTVKGRGVSFMENDHNWHSKAPNDEEYERALRELEKGVE
ncbi:transketolase [Alkalibacillus aidingensis]|uniref:transketolase n=1 Tax=Alkalibacillus aidingensis TaxID=2747607 RepID=UPI0016603FE4|nr:transketolase [Alkalibacillus aidingensis]